MIYRSFFLVLVSMVALSQCQIGAHSGICPNVVLGSSGSCGTTCQSNDDCNQNQDCCRNACGGTQCVAKGTQLVPPPSRCPSNRPGSPGTCANECSSDNSCTGGGICCGTACGGTSCMQPINSTPQQPGSCLDIQPSSIWICNNRCQSDTDCYIDQKCCPNACGGTQCVTTANNS